MRSHCAGYQLLESRRYNFVATSWQLVGSSPAAFRTDGRDGAFHRLQRGDAASASDSVCERQRLLATASQPHESM